MRYPLIAVILILIVFIFSACQENDSIVENLDDSDTSHVVLRKPNIYLYPEKTIQIEVSLIFPYSGKVIESIPEYNGGWNVSVSPEGIIDGKYEYLFYECELTDRFQYDEGWIVKGKDIERFFRSNMSAHGFIDHEINDFLEYWLPLLDENKSWLVYPQYRDIIDKYVELEFSVTPDNIFRLFYCIRENRDNRTVLNEPEIRKGKRTGFSLFEWGGILK